MKTLLTLFLSLLSMTLFAATPSFNSFDLNFFKTNNYTISSTGLESTNSLIFVSQSRGNDATALPYSSLYSFKTIGAANAVATHQGDIINIVDGIFSETNFLNSDVICQAGTFFQTNQFTVAGIGTTRNIYGYGVFTGPTGTGNQAVKHSAFAVLGTNVLFNISCASISYATNVDMIAFRSGSFSNTAIITAQGDISGCVDSDPAYVSNTNFQYNFVLRGRDITISSGQAALGTGGTFPDITNRIIDVYAWRTPTIQHVSSISSAYCTMNFYGGHNFSVPSPPATLYQHQFIRLHKTGVASSTAPSPSNLHGEYFLEQTTGTNSIDSPLCFASQTYFVTNLPAPAAVQGFGILWSSNNTLYWITLGSTNLISSGL